jgi:hypothetical protein
MSDGTKIFLGGFDAGSTLVVVPRQALAKANTAFDAEKQKRERAAIRTRLRIVQDARAQARLKRAIASAGCRWHQRRR